MSAVFHSSHAVPFGFHSECMGDITGEFKQIFNIGTVLSWIPIIGAIIGAIHLYAGYNRGKTVSGEELALTKVMMIRGGIELATLGCAGPLLFIVDMIVTLGRACTQQPSY